MTSPQRYRIKTVAEMTGIPRNTLLAWERRHGLLAPGRLENGYRLYSDDDVAVLRRVKAALASGMAISEALLAVRADGARAAAASPAGSDLATAVDELFARLVSFDRVGADAILASLGHVPFATIIDDLFMPVMRRVGDAWARGEVGVAEEHHAAGWVREQLVAVLLRLGASSARGPRVACVTFPGERHELALLGLAAHLLLRGCRLTYLGPDVPERDVADFVHQIAPDVLFVSCILAVDPDGLVRYARSIRRAAPPSTRIIIGGAGVPARVRAVRGVELVQDWRDLKVP